MNRRTFLRTAAGMVLAAGAGELWTPDTPSDMAARAEQYRRLIEERRAQRYWQLDRTMLGYETPDAPMSLLHQESGWHTVYDEWLSILDWRDLNQAPAEIMQVIGYRDTQVLVIRGDGLTRDVIDVARPWHPW